MIQSWGQTRLSFQASGRSEQSEGNVESGSLLESEEDNSESGPPEPDEGDDGESSTEEEQAQLPKDVQFDILKNRRRRLVLQYLFENENPVSIGTLSEHVAGIENGKEPHALDSQERKRAYVGLYQCHLPRMDDADVIDFNKSRGQIELGAHAEALKQHIEPPTEDRPTWPKVYLVLSLLGLGTYLVLQSQVVAEGWLGGVALAVTLAAIAAVAVAQLRHQRTEG